MKVADAVAHWLAEKGITHAFGIIGGGNVMLWDAIIRAGKTKIICVHHEQSAAMAAAYYQRTSGRPALALVTTGGGSSNALTGVLAAYMDRVPLLVISGNEASKYMDKPTRVWGVQGYDSVEAVRSYTKWSSRPSKDCVLDELEAAFDRTSEAPCGPVWVDLCKDIQGASA